MSITSVGYDGTVNELKWAEISHLLGDAGNIESFTDLAVTIAGTGSLPVTVAAGVLFGRGVMDVNSAPVLLNATALGSGTRWDTVVMARDWSSNTSVIALRAGGATAVPTLSNTSPGVIDDQPIALIKIVAGQAAVQQVVPLVGTSGKIHSFASILATIPVMPSSPQGPGTEFAFDRSNGHLWGWKVPQAGGVAAWSDLMKPEWQNIPLPSSIVAIGSTAPSFCRVNGVVFLRGTMGRSDGSSFTTGGGVGGNGFSIGNLPAGYRPLSILECPMSAYAGTTMAPGRLQVGSDGVLVGSVQGPVSTLSLAGLSFPAEL